MMEWMSKQTSNLNLSRWGRITVLRTGGAHHCLLDQPFPKCLLKSYYMPSTVLDAGSTILNKNSGTYTVVLGSQKISK